MNTKRHNIKRFLAIALTVPFLISALVTGGAVFYMAQDLLVQQAQKSVAANLRSAHELYETRKERLDEFVRSAASNLQMALTFEPGNEYFQELLDEARGKRR